MKSIISFCYLLHPLFVKKVLAFQRAAYQKSHRWAGHGLQIWFKTLFCSQNPVQPEVKGNSNKVRTNMVLIKGITKCLTKCRLWRVCLLTNCWNLPDSHENKSMMCEMKPFLLCFIQCYHFFGGAPGSNPAQEINLGPAKQGTRSASQNDR